jgi:DedD protein
MRDGNVRVRERFEVSLDGRQIASVVVGALVLLGIVFVLGVSVGRQIATRDGGDATAAPQGDLTALDRADAVPRRDDITFYDRLPNGRPAPPPAPERAAAAAPSAAPSPSPSPSAAPSAAPPDATPEPAQATAAFCIQLAAAQDRAEAERIASRYRSLSPRIEAADVPGKGRFHRVRVGSFDSRDQAERYLRDVNRETGAKGFVTACR